MMSNIGTEKILEELRVTIRQMTEHDLLEVVEIEESAGLSRWGWEGYHAELGCGRETIMLVAQPTDERPGARRFDVLGFIASRLSGDELHINNMAVRDGYRRLGIGALLLGSVIEEGKRRGALRSFLEVRETNRAAQSLYKKFGFEGSGKRRNYYTNPSEDALVMEAYLAQTLT